MNQPSQAKSLTLAPYSSSRWMRKLIAGPLTLEYSEGSLWNISNGGEEVIRRIYLVFQDINWTSRPFIIKDEIWDVADRSFSAKIKAQGSHDAKDLSVELAITGSETGEITYGFSASTSVSFMRNRLGLCLLHPVAGLAGRECELTKADGAVEISRFPDVISPNQPFLNLSGISHQLQSGQVVSVNFTGEIFETEDHRNWSDASYKTYCTPISLPFPAQVTPGETLSQKITISISGEQTTSFSTNESAVITVGAEEIELPEIGLGLSEDPAHLIVSEYAGFEDLAIKHLRLALNGDSQIRSAVERALLVTKQLKIDLDLAIKAESPQQLKAILEPIIEFKDQIRSFYIFSASDKTTPIGFIQVAEDLLGENSKIVGGTDLYFTELNRNQSAVNLVDQVNFSINPQVHSFDDRTLIQNTATQKAIATNAHRIAKGKNVSIGPITLRPRYNPNATQPAKDLSNTALPSSVDARQRTWFAEGWTAMSIRSITEPESISAVTYFETLGWRGIRELSTGSKDPSNFASQAGEEFPVWRLFNNLKGFTHARPTASSLPELVDCLIVTSGQKVKVILVNFSTIEQEVKFSGIDLKPQTLRPESVTYLEITGVANV
jgi:D-apionolactonase